MIERVFKEVHLNVNKVQCMTSSIAFQNIERVKNQCWIVAAGHGKSVIHAELAYLILRCTQFTVYVIFQNEGLKKVDEDRNVRLSTFCENAGFKWKERVRYVTDLPRTAPKKDTYYIIDESDERMFGDCLQFYKSIKSEKIRTICLTATAYDGDEECVERECLKALDFKIYANSKKKEDFVPTIHE